MEGLISPEGEEKKLIEVGLRSNFLSFWFLKSFRDRQLMSEIEWQANSGSAAWKTKK